MGIKQRTPIPRNEIGSYRKKDSKEVCKMSIIKNKYNNLRTKISELLPKLLSFSKYIFIAILSGIIWLLHFIGYGTEILLELTKQFKDRMRGK